MFRYYNMPQSVAAYSIQNIIKIGLYFTKIWQQNDFDDGGRPSF